MRRTNQPEQNRSSNRQGIGMARHSHLLHADTVPTKNCDVTDLYEHACMEDPNLFDVSNLNATSNHDFTGFFGMTSIQHEPDEPFLSDRPASLNSSELVESDTVDLFVSSPFDSVDFGDAHEVWLALMLRNFGNAIRFVWVLKFAQVFDIVMTFLSFVWVFIFSRLFGRYLGRQLYTLRYFTVLLIIVHLCYYPVNSFGSANQFYLCPAGIFGHAVMPPNKVDCAVPDTLHDHIIKINVTLWGHRSKLLEFVGLKCYLQTHIVCTHYGLVFSKGIVRNEIIQTYIDPHECVYAWRSKIFRQQPVSRRSDNLWTTLNNLDIKYEFCCYDFCQNVTNIFIEVGIVSTFNGVHLLSNLGDLGGAKFENKFALSSNYVITRIGDLPKKFCSYVRMKTYIGKFLMPYLIIESLQGSFTLNYIQRLCNTTAVYTTYQGALFELGPNTDNIRNKSEVTFDSQLNDDNNYELNSKLQFLYDKIKQIETDNFRNIWLELCKSSQKHLNLVWQLLKFDSSLGARALFGRQDIAASFVGDVLVVHNCFSLTADVIYWNHTVGGKCFDHLPILIKNKLWFVLPGSRDLTPISTPVDCHLKPSGIYRINKTWYSVNGPVHVSELTTTFLINASWSSYTFNSTSPQQPRYFESIYTLGLLKSYAYRTNNLERQLDNVINYTAALSLSPDVIYNVLKGTGSAFSEIIKAEGDTFEHFVNSTGTLVSHGINLIGGPIQLAINIIITIVVFISIIYVLYAFSVLSLMRKCFRKSKTCCPNSFRFLKKSRFTYSQNNRHETVRMSSLDNLSSIVVPEIQLNQQNNSVKDTTLGEIIIKALAPLNKQCLAASLDKITRTPTIQVVLTNPYEPSRTVTVSAIIDTGSEISLLRKNIFDSLNLKVQAGSNITLTQAGGQTKTLSESACVVCQFVGVDNIIATKHITRVFVIEDCPVLFLLGKIFSVGFLV